jgi:hypothetical protein
MFDLAVSMQFSITTACLKRALLSLWAAFLSAYNLGAMGQHVHWAILAALWAGVGPLVGVLVGAYLTNRIQRRLWLADHKRQEYRELFTVMTNAFGKLLELNNTVSLTVTELNTIRYKS